MIFVYSPILCKGYFLKLVGKEQTYLRSHHIIWITGCNASSKMLLIVSWQLYTIMMKAVDLLIIFEDSSFVQIITKQQRNHSCNTIFHGSQCQVRARWITGVKQPWAGLVLGWVTSEYMRHAHRLKLTRNAVDA